MKGEIVTTQAPHPTDINKTAEAIDALLK